MSAPVILDASSVLEYLQWQTLTLQPFATNSPTSWIASFLAPGLTLDPATGAITGTLISPGVYSWDMIAINSDGPSDPLVFTMGVEATTATPPVDAIELSVDLGTKEVTCLTPTTRQIARVTPGPPGDPAAAVSVMLTPLFWLKRGDYLLVHVRFWKNGVVAPLTLDTLEIGFKTAEPADVLFSSDTFVQADTGADTFFRLALDVSGDAITNALFAGQNDLGTEIPLLMELHWTADNTLSPVAGSTPLKTAALNSWVGLARDMALT